MAAVGHVVIEMAPRPTARTRLIVAALALSAALGIVAAAINGGGGLQIATATTHVMVDAPASEPSLAFQRALPQDVQTAVKHSELVGRVAVSPPVLDRVASLCGVPRSEVSGLARTTADVPLAFIEPDSERRASEIISSRSPYRLEVQGRPLMPLVGSPTPVFDVYTQAPTTAGAECLATGVVTSSNSYLRDLSQGQGKALGLVRLRPIGDVHGVVANGRAGLAIAVLTFLVVFGLAATVLCALIVWRDRRLAADRAVAPYDRAEPDQNGHRTDPGPLDRLRSRLGSDYGADDRWPRTRRVLPWTLAVFIALIWLVPFNSLELNASVGIDMTLDRIVLPVVALFWGLALLAHGTIVPRLRLTWIHVALAFFLAVALLSVVLDARYLNQTLELDLSLKKLPLLVSYIAVFVLTASAVRRREVPAFLSLTLGLAVICAIGMIYEYRSNDNPFWNLSDGLLPGFSLSGQLDPEATVDSIGRRIVRGPGETPLEAVAMLSLALPIALVRLVDAGRWRQRLMYALAACLLAAAVFATYRKSAMIAPAAIVLTLLFFRRKSLYKLAPLAMILLVTVMILAPGALSSVTDQFTRSDATTLPTVSDRSSDYDAIRPDVWSNLALGRGWGTYNHESYRILDSEILHRTIETGVIGLIAFLLIPVAVLATVRRSIRSPDRSTAQIAVIGAAAAVGFFVLALLFDVMSFPHVPYVFLYMAGLVTVVVGRESEPAAESPPVSPIDLAAGAGALRAKESLAPAR